MRNWTPLESKQRLFASVCRPALTYRHAELSVMKNWEVMHLNHATSGQWRVTFLAALYPRNADGKIRYDSRFTNVLIQAEDWFEGNKALFSCPAQLPSAPARPDPPIVGKVTHHSIELYWDHAQAWTDGGAGTPATEEDKNKGFATIYVGYAKTYTIEGLDPLTQYRYRLRAVNDEEASGFSPAITVSTTREPLTSEHLHKAVNNNDVQAVIQILEAGETTEHISPSEDGETKWCRFRRDVGVDVPDKYGLTALMSASQRGFSGIIDVLMKCGASVQEKNSSGKNCLMLACFAGHLEIVKQLRGYGCDWETRDLGGCTAMHWACDGGHGQVVDWMIQDGAEVDVKDYKSGWTPLFRVAALNGDPQIAQLLIQAGADVNRKDKDGKTPLMIAALNGHKKLVQLLVESGADFKVKNEFGSRAVEMAHTFDRRPVVKYLEELQESDEEKRKQRLQQLMTILPDSTEAINKAYLRNSIATVSDMDSKVRVQKPNPLKTANALSTLLFWWMNPLFKVGYKRKLEEDDMFNVLHEDSSCKLRTDLERAWNVEKSDYSKPRLLRALGRCYGKGWILLGIPLVIEETMKVAQPLLMSRLILYFSPGSHALRLSNAALLKTTTGQIVNLMSNDVNRFDLGFQFIHYLWIGPVQAIVISAILWGELGPSCLAGLGFMLFLFPVQSAMGKLFSKFRSQTADRTDERVRTMSEIISAMRVIKMYTWEEPFGTLVKKQRRREVQKIAKAVTSQGLNLAFSYISVRVISLLAFVTYTLLGNAVTPSKVFTAIALYNVLQFTLLKFVPLAVQFLSEVLIAIHRIQFVPLPVQFLSEVLIAIHRIQFVPLAVQFLSEVLIAIHRIQFVPLAVQFLSEVLIAIHRIQFVPLAVQFLSEVLIAIHRIQFVPLVVQFLSEVLIAIHRIQFVPLVVQFLSEVLIAIHRIQDFLLLDEVSQLAISDTPEKNQDEHVHPTSNNIIKKETKKAEGFLNKAFTTDAHDGKDPVQPPKFSGKATSDDAEDKNYKISSLDISPSVVVSNLSAKWDESKEVQTLKNMNFKVKDGQLFTVVGSVGSGKSSLLSVILGELPAASGGVKVDGKVSYAAQQAWVFSGTVRQNIVFGQPYDHLKYWKVIDCCGLSKDLEVLPNSDLTLVGDRGITLSGGQKARINLARAVYRDADIYLLDDPLSAVDAKGMLKNKLRILVTHQLQYLVNSDQILIMNEGRQLAVGTYPELVDQGFVFSDLVHAAKKEDGQTVLPSKRLVRRQSSIRSGVVDAVDTIDDEPTGDTAPEEPDEDRFEGSVSLRVYWDYLTAGFGKFGLLLSLVLNIVYQGSYVFTDWWLAHWAAKEEEYLNTRTNHSSAQNISEKETIPPTVDSSFYLYVFTGVTVAVVVLSTVRTLFMFYNCIMASHNLHNSMFHAIIRTPILFFDTNPVGRILNRFSKDMGQLDEQLPWQFVEFVQYTLLTVGVVILTGVVNPWVFIPVVPLLLIFLYLRQYFLATSRDVKRLEATTRSPVFSHLSATLQGLTTIRALVADSIVLREFDAHQDQHSEAWFLYLCTTRWLAIRLDLLTAAFITSVTFCSVLAANSLDGGLVGLTVSYAIVVTVFFQWTVRLSTEVETMMTSAERVLEYTRLDPEVEPETKVYPPAGWPQHGSIALHNASFSYSKDGPEVLKELNETIAAQEKVGIVGRTGAGKSSLMHMLLRMAEIKGAISIDGVDISTLGLSDLRSRISVIPQDPVLFSGSLRKNLDPFDQYTDSELWAALEQVQLKHVVGELSMALEAELAECGTNFSVGQRQLVCLARALLRKTKILIIDEATANVDPRTDELIQRVIRSRFEHCTVLTIAHRLNTVIDSGRIMVIDDARIVEFGEPYRLLEAGDSGRFARLVAELGTAEAARMRSAARQCFQRRHAEPQTVDTRL
ncbi:Multidrug resistance-associated protein 4 [Branchiostoma belcheri]|nr:Multidrug resistance-associated protein 4 [Branchiostoma belcheri]